MTSEKMSYPKGEYHPARPDDLRAPCPVLNALANHGIIARDGRNITAAELKSAVRYLGLGPDVAAVLVGSAFKVHADDPKTGPPGSARSGLRDADQVNSDGTPVLNLDQVGRPNATEHDVSVTRQDREIGDYMHLDPDLYESFIAGPKDGQNLTVADFGKHRKTRYDEQKRDNPQLDFDKRKHYVACAEAAAIQCVFGAGIKRSVPIEYIRALFGEERLPYREGWTPRWLKVFFPEIVVVILRVSSYAWPF